MESISFIFPLYNEEKYIGKCLSRVIDSASKCDVQYELIVVDNLSSDRSVEEVSKFPATLITCHKKGPAACRNLGASIAKNRVLAFIDSDCLITKCWVEEVIKTFRMKTSLAYGGPVLAPSDGTWVERAWSAKMVKPYYTQSSSLPGANFCIGRDLFYEVGGFREDLISAEDDELSKRVVSNGYSCINDSEHVVIHLGYPKTLSDVFYKQIWQASSQLKAHGILGDKMVTATLCWGALILLLFGMAVTQGFSSITLSVVVIVLMFPVLVAYKRTRAFKGASITERAGSVLVSTVFLLGRLVGHIREIYSMLKN